jgi:hypothetical protein
MYNTIYILRFTALRTLAGVSHNSLGKRVAFCSVLNLQVPEGEGPMIVDWINDINVVWN